MTTATTNRYPAGTEHTVFIRQNNGGRYEYALSASGKNSGYFTSYLGSFMSEYEAFQSARETVEGHDDYRFYE